jgi:hypothetical protein
MFSKRFASAMELAHQSGSVKSDTIADTAAFCRDMDKIIDACNSSCLYNPNPAKRPLSAENPGVEMILRDFLSWAPEMTVCVNNKWKRPFCFGGIVQTVSGILETYLGLIDEFPEFELCTALCNQDSVEQLFSRFRGRGGFNPNPTCRMFRLAARHLISVRNVIPTKRGNVVCSELPYLPPLTDHVDETDLQYKASVSAVAFFEEGTFSQHDDSDDVLYDGAEVQSDTDDEQDQDLDLVSRVRLAQDVPLPVNSGSYEANAIAFFAGYTIHKMLKVHHCDRCQDVVAKGVGESLTANETYTECREYVTDDTYTVTKLKRPTAKFHQIVEVQLQSFLPIFIRHKYKVGILAKLVSHAVEATNKVDPHWFDEADPCHSHRMFAVRFMLRVKLQRHCTFDNRAAKVDRVNKRKATASAHHVHKPVRKMRNILHT